MENLIIKKIKIKINTEQKIDKNKEEIINVFRNNVRGHKFEKDPSNKHFGDEVVSWLDKNVNKT